MKNKEINKNGFTLIEIIVAIALIVVISTTTIVLLQKKTTNIEQEKKEYMSALETSANVFMETYKDKNRFKLQSGTSAYIALSELVDKGYIDENLENPYGDEYNCIEILNDMVVGDITMKLVNYDYCPTNIRLAVEPTTKPIVDPGNNEINFTDIDGTHELPSSLDMLEEIKNEGDLFEKLYKREITMSDIIVDYIKNEKIELSLPDLILFVDDVYSEQIGMNVNNIKSININNTDKHLIKEINEQYTSQKSGYYSTVVFDITLEFTDKYGQNMIYTIQRCLIDDSAPILYNANYNNTVSDEELIGEEYELGKYGVVLNISNVKYDTKTKLLSRYSEDTFQIITYNNEGNNNTYLDNLIEKKALMENEQKDMYFYFDNFFGLEKKSRMEIGADTLGVNLVFDDKNLKFLDNEKYSITLYNQAEYNEKTYYGAQNNYNVYFNYVDILPAPETMYVGPSSICIGDDRMVSLSEFEEQVRFYHLSEEGKGKSGIIDVYNEGQDYSADYKIEFCDYLGECRDSFSEFHGWHSNIMLTGYSNKYQDKDSIIIRKLAEVEACGYNDIDPRTYCEMMHGGYYVGGSCLTEDEYCKTRCCGRYSNASGCREPKPASSSGGGGSASATYNCFSDASCVRGMMIKNSENWHASDEIIVGNPGLKQEVKDIFHRDNASLGKIYANITGTTVSYDSPSGIWLSNGSPIYTSDDLNLD